jgi:hypothetical protein
VIEQDHIGSRAGLGQQNAVRRACHHCSQIGQRLGIGHRVSQRIDTHPALLTTACLGAAQIVRDQTARKRQPLGRDGVFQIEDEGISLAGRSLVEFLLAVAGNEQHGSQCGGHG